MGGDDGGKRRQKEGDQQKGGSYSSSQESEDDNDQEDRLAALEAHFARNFDLPMPRAVQDERRQRRGEDQSAKSKSTNTAHKKTETVSRSPDAKKPQPVTIVFGETSSSGSKSTPSSSSTPTSSGWKKFMSSKVTTKTDEEKQAILDAKKKKGGKSKRKEGEAEKDGEENEEDEKQALTNDRALSQLLSTTLFAPGGAGAPSRRSSGKPNLGSNDTLARLMELSQPSTTGKAQSQGRGYGEAMLKSSDMSKMPATIRHGMRRVEMENHHSIKGLLGKREGLDLILGTKDKDRKKRSREKGLAMGVGKFSGGTLKLSDRDVQRINNSGTSQKRTKR
jgi:hypothetical protein